VSVPGLEHQKNANLIQKRPANPTRGNQGKMKKTSEIDGKHCRKILAVKGSTSQQREGARDTIVPREKIQKSHFANSRTTRSEGEGKVERAGGVRREKPSLKLRQRGTRKTQRGDLVDATSIISERGGGSN